MSRRPQRKHGKHGEHGEHGAATVLVITFAGVLISVAAACAVVIGLVADHHRAEAAADLAALSAASALNTGAGQDPCAVAEAVARRNGATLVTCRVEGAEVWARVSVASSWLHGVDLTARARAGPPLS